MSEDIVSLSKQLRTEYKELEDRVRALMNDEVFKGDGMFPGQHGEMKANIMLAVRHSEDARMRLGKVCQYADDGVSVFDKEKGGEG